MQKIDAKALPECVHIYLDAINQADSPRFLSALSADALVNDVQRNFLGTKAVKGWSDREVMVDEVVLKVHQAFEHYGDYIVEVDTDGNFDKTHLPDPLILTQHFTVRDDKIVKLISILVKTSDVMLEDGMP